MNWESLFEFTGFIGAIVAAFYFFHGGHRAFTKNAASAMKIVLAVSLLKYGINAAEWSGIFADLNLDYAEDYLDDIWPFVWFIFFFTAMLDSSAESIRQSEKRYRMLFNHTMDAIFVFDQKQSLVNFNKPAIRLTGYDHEDLSRLKITDIFPDVNISALCDRSNGSKTLNGKTETLLTHKTGHDIIIELSGQEVIIDRRKVLLTVARDISEKRSREEELIKIKKLEALGVMAGGIAHDFNNFLMGIMGNISLLKFNSELSQKTYNEIDGIEKAAIRAKDLTQQLLTFAKGGEPVKNLSDIGELIRETAEFALRGSKAKAVFKIDPKLYQAKFDKGQIAQVISNLVINADQAMPDGGMITIEAWNVEFKKNQRINLAPGPYVKINIRDRGVGIPENHLHKVFDPYFSTKDKGSGLGLAVVISVIEKHQGVISVCSDVDKGSEFEFYLPASEQRLVAAKPFANTLRRKSGKILVMDDDKTVRETVSAMLNVIGFQVETTRDGEEAINVYKRALKNERPYDIVILDLTVPGAMGGEEAVSRLIEIDPNVKAIVSSGYSNDPVMSCYKDYGFKGVLQKPYLLQNIKRTIFNLINVESN